MQELRLSNISVLCGADDNDGRTHACDGPRGGSCAALAHLRRLALAVQADGHSVQTDVLQQLAVLAPLAGQLTALELWGGEVLDRTRAAEFAASLRLLPKLQDLEVSMSGRGRQCRCEPRRLSRISSAGCKSHAENESARESGSYNSKAAG